MLSLYNSLGLDGGSVSTGNKLLVIGNNIRGSFPEYDRTTFKRDIPNPNDRPGDSNADDLIGTRPEENNQNLDQSRADINQDGIVDGADLTVFMNDFYFPANRAGNQRSDINESGFVDGADLSLLLTNWGRQFDVGDLGVASGSYDVRPDLGIRPSRPDGRPKKPSDLGVASGSYDVRPDLGIRPSRPDGGGRPKPKPSIFAVGSGRPGDVRPDLGVRPSKPDGEDDGGGKPDDPPPVGVIQTTNGLVYPTSRVDVATSPALPAWLKGQKQNV